MLFFFLRFSSCFLQAIFISIWCLWAKSLYILATSHLLKKRVKNITRGGTNGKKIHSDAFYSSRLSVRPAHLLIQPMNVRMWGCVGGASSAEGQRQRRSIAPTRGPAPGLCLVDVNELHHLLQRCGRIFGRCYFSTQSSWGSISSQVTRSARVLRREANKNTTVINVCMRACFVCVYVRVCVCERWGETGCWKKPTQCVGFNNNSRNQMYST